MATSIKVSAGKRKENTFIWSEYDWKDKWSID